MEEAHVTPQEALPTLCSTRVRVPLLSGDAVGGLRLMSAKEAARLMGVQLRGRAWKEAASRFSEQRLWEVVADAIDAHHVRAMWENAEEMMEASGRQMRGRVLRYAGSHVGALDTILMGGRARGLRVVCRAVAELDKARRTSVGEAYLVPAARRFKTAWGMARAFLEELDVASMTPSCRLVSSAQREGWESRRQRAWAQLRDDVLAFEQLVINCSPAVVFMEESAGLLTHNRELFGWVQRRLASWPYDWRAAEVDAASLGASHHRRRILWVGVRRQA